MMEFKDELFRIVNLVLYCTGYELAASEDSTKHEVDPFQTTLAFLPGHPHFVVFLPNLNPFLASQIHRPNSSN